jgi:hypothetical protein
MLIGSDGAKDHGIAQAISLFLTLLLIRAINTIKMIRKTTGGVKINTREKRLLLSHPRFILLERARR